MLPVDVKYHGKFIMPINCKWKRDGKRFYCHRCEEEIENFKNENNEQEKDMYDFHDSPGGIKNRADKEARILTALENGPLTVTEISRITMLPRSTTAQRLRTLQREKKVTFENRLWRAA